MRAAFVDASHHNTGMRQWLGRCLLFKHDASSSIKTGTTTDSLSGDVDGRRTDNNIPNGIKEWEAKQATT
jgi:hypothetical protein